MYYFVCTSSASKPLPDSELMKIKEQSKAACDKADVTGLMVLHRSVFIHCYEGDKSAINKIVSALGNDKRHKDIKVLGEGETSKQQFPNWSMELRVLDKDPLFTPEALADDPAGVRKQINDVFLSIK
ncbi:MAG: blue light sensor protein [Burkholderiaceae bacterium]|nr:blue light sensor protein [Burkholderiaceae bacterium]